MKLNKVKENFKWRIKNGKAFEEELKKKDASSPNDKKHRDIHTNNFLLERYAEGFRHGVEYCLKMIEEIEDEQDH